MGKVKNIIHVLNEEKKQAEAELSHSEERYELIFNTAVEGIITLSMNGTILEVNPAFEKITGYGKEELMNKNILGLARLFKLDSKMCFIYYISLLQNIITLVSYYIYICA